MKRLVFVLLSVTILVASAGCAGVLEDGTTEERVEEADGAMETGGTDADETDEAAEYPYGDGENGLDAGELASRQAAIFDSESYAIESRETSESDDGIHEQSTELVVDGDRTMQKRNWEYDPSSSESVLGPSTGATWLFRESANETLVRRVDGSEERYRVMGAAAPASDEQGFRKEVTAMLRVSGYELTDVEEADGETIATYEGTEMSDDFERLHPAVEEFDDFTATISVSDDGIERYAYELEATSRGTAETIAVETTFSNVGETDLERPAWVDEGYERAPEASLSLDGDTVAVALESGEPMPENSTVRLSIGPDTYRASLDEAFEPGETLYLALRDDQLRAAVDAEPGAGDAIETRLLSVSISTDSGLTAYEEFYEE